MIDRGPWVAPPGIPSPIYRVEQRGGGLGHPQIEYRVVEIDTHIVIMRTFHRDVADRYCSDRNRAGAPVRGMARQRARRKTRRK